MNTKGKIFFGYVASGCFLALLGSVVFFYVEGAVALIAIGVISLLFISWLGAVMTGQPIERLRRGVFESEESGWQLSIPTMRETDSIGELSRALERMRLLVKSCETRVEKEVRAQTKEIVKREKQLEDQQSAILNILDDLEAEKKKLEEEKAKDDAILDNVGDGLVVLDVKERVRVMNVAAQEMLGLAASRVIGKQWSATVKMTDESGKTVPGRERPYARSLATGKKMASKEYYFTRKDKTRFPANTVASPVLFGGKVIGAVIVFHDIAKEKEVDRAKTEFVSLASHQLRTPLSAINWYAEMLLAGDVGKLNKEQREYLEEIYRGNKRMVTLVGALLNVSRIELGTMAILPAPTDLAEIAEDALKELVPQITLKNFRIVKKFDAAPRVMDVDPKLTRVIFQNLLSNAVKYTPANGTIAVSIERKDPNVLITVADTGYGIPASVHQKIFTKLFRADNARERDAEGTGLGLYIVKSILDESGGMVWFDSAENKGTTFYVTLPLAGMKKREGVKGPEDMSS